MLDINTLSADLERHFDSLDFAMTKVERIAADYLLAKLQTKITPLSSVELDVSSYQKFRHCNTVSGQWVDRLETLNTIDFEILEIMRGELHRLFDDEPCTLEEIMWEADLGPGSNVGSHWSCSYPLKIGLQLSGTIPALRLVRAASALYNLHLGEASKDLVVNGSNISFVPKTATSSRMIATEPTANMLLQKGIDAIFRRVLKRLGIDMRNQPDVNRLLAKKGSIDGSYSTIDLSSASDLLSMDLVRYIFPPRICKWIEVARCDSASYTFPNGTVDNFKVECATTAGNGFCSSLQTLVFAILTYACGDNKPCAFGDDIIVPTRLFSRVTRALVSLGFSPNMGKTFDESLPSPFAGRFRESCGHDYLDGVNIRPVFIKTLMEVDTVIIYNQLKDWFERLSLPFPFEPCKAPFKSAAGIVPLHYPEDSGYRDGDYERFVKTARVKVREIDGSTSYVSGAWFRVFKARSEFASVEQESIGDCVITSIKGPKALVRDLERLSERQLTIALLRGVLRAGKILVRPKHVEYDIKLVFDALPCAWSKWLP